MVKKTNKDKNDLVPKPSETAVEPDDSFYRGKAGEYVIDEHGRHVPAKASKE